MNSPKIPGQKKKGTNAATVVNVDVVMGQATSAVPALAASILLSPIIRWR